MAKLFLIGFLILVIASAIEGIGKDYVSVHSFTKYTHFSTAQNHFSTKLADNVFLTWDIGDYITMTATFFNNLGWAGIGLFS